MIDSRVILLILTMAIVTAAIRFLPFVIFKGRQTPDIINFLGKYLPYAVIAMLVVYCVKDISIVEKPHGLPELIAVVVTALLHILKRNTLLSIVAGTLCYMFLTQMVFI